MGGRMQVADNRKSPNQYGSGFWFIGKQQAGLVLGNQDFNTAVFFNSSHQFVGIPRHVPAPVACYDALQERNKVGANQHRASAARTVAIPQFAGKRVFEAANIVRLRLNRWRVSSVRL